MASPPPARWARDPPPQSTSDVSDVDQAILPNPGTPGFGGRAKQAASPQIHDAGFAVLGPERKQAAGRAPGERRDARRAGMLREDLGAVLQPHQQHEPVRIADRDDRLSGMAGDNAR